MCLQQEPKAVEKVCKVLSLPRIVQRGLQGEGGLHVIQGLPCEASGENFLLAGWQKDAKKVGSEPVENRST